MLKSPSNVNSSFGAWLRVRRRELDLTQDALGEQVGCSGDTIRKIELGARRPSKQIAELLVGVLKVPDAEIEHFIQFARTGFPARDTSISVETNLPAPVTLFVGREREMELLRKRLLQDDVRLLTLTGPPGVGKTRLALEVARSLVGSFEHGTFLVKLASLNIPELVTSTIGGAIGLKEAAAPAPPISDIQALKSYLRDRQVLLLLDNFEHLLSAASVVTELLEACPRLKALITSREPLDLYPEHRFSVLPLELPERRQLSSFTFAAS